MLRRDSALIRRGILAAQAASRLLAARDCVAWSFTAAFAAMEERDPTRKRLPVRRRGIYLLPNLLTTAGLFAGFYSIIAAIDGNFVRAAVAIFVAMVLDGADGRIARMTSTSSEFGKEFDSLADMVSFGLTPAIVTYQWGVERLSEYGAVWGRLGWLAAFLYVAAAAFRLARFNSNVAWTDRRYFQGLPSPAAAGTIAALVLVSAAYDVNGLIALIAGIAITAAVAVLMVSRFSYPSFKEIKPGQRVRYTRLLLIPLVIIVVALDPPAVSFILFAAYAASAPTLWLWRRSRRLRSD
jgi:CDP-diacylglycerol--serine O-phosphatidyltransferase